MRKFLAPLCALVALVAWSDRARAVVVTASSGPFSAGNSNTNNDITFDSLTTPNTFANTSIHWGAAPASLGGIAFSGTAIIANNAAGTSAGISATPAGDTTNYMSILGGNSETLTSRAPRTSSVCFGDRSIPTTASHSIRETAPRRS